MTMNAKGFSNARGRPVPSKDNRKGRERHRVVASIRLARALEVNAPIARQIAHLNAFHEFVRLHDYDASVRS